MRKLLYLLPVLVFAAVGTYFAIALRPDHDPRALPSALIDKPAPIFARPSLLGGAEVDTSALRGQVIVVNFFASWCVPCRLEHPILMRLAAREKIAITGVSYKDNPDDSKRILTQLGDPYAAVAIDRDGRVGFDYGVYGVPETFVIDKQGRIRKRFAGPLAADTVEQELLPLLRELEKS